MIKNILSFVSYHLEYFLSCSVTRSCLTLCDPMDSACQASLSFTMFQTFLKFMSIESVMPSSHFILCCPLLLPSSFPASGSFPMSWLFTSGGQSIGTSALASVLPMNIQGWLPLRLNGLISLMSKEISRVFSSSPPKPPNACQLGKSMGIKKRLRKISWLDYRKEPKIS